MADPATAAAALSVLEKIMEARAKREALKREGELTAAQTVAGVKSKASQQLSSAEQRALQNLVGGLRSSLL